MQQYNKFNKVIRQNRYYTYEYNEFNKVIRQNGYYIYEFWE